MAEENILIDGERYISSGRAAKLVGYTKDYVGQLARDGKIIAKRIGRNWYIEERSVNKHKLSVHYTLTKPKKKKDNDGEITIHNIDNSVVKRNSVDIKKNTISNPPILQTDIQAEVIRKERKDEVVDLFPQPRKKNRDPLLHSDIRFESGYQAPRQVANERPKVSENHVFKHVPIRSRPTPRFMEEIRTSSTGVIKDYPRRKNPIASLKKKPVIDGIIMSPRHFPNQSKSNRFIQESEPVSSTDFLAMKQRKEVFSQTEDQSTSKAIPVIGAIVIFTIFVVAYIFLTGGEI